MATNPYHPERHHELVGIVVTELLGYSVEDRRRPV